MPIPDLLVQFQCTAPACSRMSSPLNILRLLPTVEEFMMPSSTNEGGTTAIPFVTMRLKGSAEQSCPFCRSQSRIVPVDPSFQSPELRTALRTMFGSFFGHIGPGIQESQNVQWEPVQAPGNETGPSVGVRVQWVLVGDQVHQLLISTSPFARSSQAVQPLQQQRRLSMSQTTAMPTPEASVAQTSPGISSEDGQDQFLSMLAMQQFLPWPGGHVVASPRTNENVPVLSPTAFPFEGLPEFQQEGQVLAFDRFSSAPPQTPSSETTEQEPSWAEVARRGASQ